MLQYPLKITGLLKQISVPLSCQTRNTFILKRRYPYELSKKNRAPRPTSNRHYIYELIEDTNIRKHNEMEVILTKYVAGLGNPGAVVSIKPRKAYNELLLPGLAVYKTPENVKKYQNFDAPDEIKYSSPFVSKTMQALYDRICLVNMSKTEPWVIEPWHISASYRQLGFVVPPHAIELPSQEIRGPDLSLEGKEFLIKVTLNKTETVDVRCRIHHWGIGEHFVHLDEDHLRKRAQPVFSEQAEQLSKMPIYKEIIVNQ